MTFEELKAEAKTYGYRLAKIQPNLPLSKCHCGAKNSVKYHWCIYGYYFNCFKCGLEADPSKNYRQARRNWNKVIEESKNS